MRVVLLGMNSPRTGEPFDTVGGTGRRLLQLLGDECFDVFEKRNILAAKKWDRLMARRAASRLLPRLSGAVVAVFGVEAWRCLSLPDVTWLGSCRAYGATFYKVPHPSGRNRYYNDRKRLTKMARTLRRIAGMIDE